jgi:thiamine-phosphate pyrophosphorylase
MNTHNTNKKLAGLYAITSHKLLQHKDYIKIITAKIHSFSLLQYRNKMADYATKKKQASKILNICQKYNTPFIINDDVSLCADIGADGVHIGDDDMGIIEAKNIVGDDAIIGVSCYNDIKKAQKMQQQGVSYVAFGRLFPSTTKPFASSVDITTITKAKEILNIPVCVIGGVDFARIKWLQEKKINLFAMCSAVWHDSY